MAPCNAASWSVGGARLLLLLLLLLGAALGAEAAALGAGAEAGTTTLLPPAVDPKLTLDLPQVPNTVVANTLIATSVLLQLGALDSDNDETIDLRGTTALPVPHLAVEALPGSVALKEEEEEEEKEKAGATTTTASASA